MRYIAGKRTIQYKLPYGGRKEITEEWLVVDTGTDTPADDQTFPTQNEAKIHAFQLEKEKRQ